MDKALLSLALATSFTIAAQEKPNIILILADDLGFSDIGCFGGEINTPVLDKMAQDGIRLTQMYSSARSCPSRANLLTGLYPHQTGVGHMDGEHPLWPKGYSGFRSNADNITIAEILKQAGYYTAMAGKWHLGRKATPIDRGFQEYYGLLGGFNSFWDEEVYKRLPQNRKKHNYGPHEFYATNAITDYAIDFINDANQQGKPLFLYLAYNAPHFPLHAPKEYVDKYMDIYLQGWDKIRDLRWEQIAKMNILQGNPELSPRGDVPESMVIDESYPIPAWDSLSIEQQTDLARRMAIFAAMVEIMDTNIGRVIDTLEKNGDLDNTFIIFMSDNGACAEWHEFGFDGHSGKKYHIHTGSELEQMGQAGTYHHYGSGWANVCCTPLSYYKHYSYEGGISTPCIVRWGNHIKNIGSVNHQPLQFIDIMPTCCALAGTTYPNVYEGREIKPAKGLSILPILNNDTLPLRSIFMEHEGNRMVRKGKWKLVSAHLHQDKWELYDISTDRTEQHNVSDKFPQIVKQLSEEYEIWAKESDVLYFPTMWNTYNTKRKKDIKEYNSSF